MLDTLRDQVVYKGECGALLQCRMGYWSYGMGAGGRAWGGSGGDRPAEFYFRLR